MTHLYKAGASRQLDSLSEALGISTDLLMANAGRAIADFLIQNSTPSKGPILLFIGRGNNGGDALVAEKHLKEKGFETVVIKDAAQLAEGKKKLKRAAWIVDGLLGVGLKGDVRGWYAEGVQAINASSAPVLAIDIPSGLSADTGKPLGIAVKASVTVCLGGVKLGCLLYPGCEYAGRIESVDIGIPEKAYAQVKSPYYLSEPANFKSCFSVRNPAAHKKDYGHVLVAAGSKPMPGAGFLAAHAALRGGAGVSTYALPKGAYQKFDPEYSEVMMSPVEDKGKGFFVEKSAGEVLALCEGKEVLLLGPGLGRGEETVRFVKTVIKNAKLPLVLDADGLNCIEGEAEILSKREYPTILTPHPGEMGRLLGCSAAEVEAARVEKAMEGAKRWNVCLVLKGYRSLIATDEGLLYVNPTGNPGMATAGAGDVLAGVIAGIAAQGFPAQKALLAAVYLHGLAGDMGAEEMGEKGLIASDIVRYLPKAIHLIEQIT